MTPRTLEAIARWRIGQTAYYVTQLRRDRPTAPHSGHLDRGLYHPREEFESRCLERAWSTLAAPPRLPAAEFNGLMSLLECRLAIRPLVVEQLRRSRESGIIYYSGRQPEEGSTLTLPESCLFDTEIAARKERDRIRRLVARWAAGEL